MTDILESETQTIDYELIIRELRADLEGSKAAHSQANERLNTFIEKLANIVGSPADMDNVISFVAALVKQEDLLNAQIKDITKQSEAREHELKEQNHDLNSKITQLEKQVFMLEHENKMQALKIGDLQAGINDIKLQQTTIKEKQDDFKTFKTFINKVKDFLCQNGFIQSGR